MPDSFFIDRSTVNGALLSFDVYRRVPGRKPQLVGRVDTFETEDPRMALLSAYEIKFMMEGPVQSITEGF